VFRSGDAELRTASPTEADRLLSEEGPVSSARARDAPHVIAPPLCGVFHEEDHMTTTIFWAIALVAMDYTIRTVDTRQHFARVPQHRGRR
jgi:hypothetical protein